MYRIIGALLLILAMGYSSVTAADDPIPGPVMHVKAIADDFEVTGEGTAPAWQDVAWTTLERRSGAVHDYSARVKLVYSPTGLYLLMSGSDRQLTASMKEDFMDLWKEDVFEFFLWTDTRWPVYFEYEISPLGKELPILIPNFDGKFLGWQPWHYEGERRTRKAVSIQGGEAKSNAAITQWQAEVYVPYRLLEPLQNVPPRKGSRWRANFYRVDYDGGQESSWDWARVGPSFHEFEKFGTLIFD